jgi:hypothetical protein
MTLRPGRKYEIFFRQACAPGAKAKLIERELAPRTQTYFYFRGSLRPGRLLALVSFHACAPGAGAKKRLNLWEVQPEGEYTSEMFKLSYIYLIVR